METMTRLNSLHPKLFWRKTYATFVFFLGTKNGTGNWKIFGEGKDAFLSYDSVAVDDRAT